MKIAIGNDHAGTAYKLAIIGFLKSKNIEVFNYGTDGTDSVDYPDFVHPVAQDIQSEKADFGIIICGSGNGALCIAPFLCEPSVYFIMKNNPKVFKQSALIA